MILFFKPCFQRCHDILWLSLMLQLTYIKEMLVPSSPACAGCTRALTLLVPLGCSSRGRFSWGGLRIVPTGARVTPGCATPVPCEPFGKDRQPLSPRASPHLCAGIIYSSLGKEHPKDDSRCSVELLSHISLFSKS